MAQETHFWLLFLVYFYILKGFSFVCFIYVGKPFFFLANHRMVFQPLCELMVLMGKRILSFSSNIYCLLSTSFFFVWGCLEKLNEKFISAFPQNIKTKDV